MKTEYKDLNTGLEVFQAQERGEKIEYAFSGTWKEWVGTVWQATTCYRSVHEVKTKKVKFLGWVDEDGELRLRKEFSHISHQWTRSPSADVEYEVEE